jgi:putative ABC transport system ATP-binding protein
MTNNNILELKNVSKMYHHPSGQDIPALSNISLKVKKGSLIIIQGPSGSGKSTLLKIIGMIEKPSHGSLILNGEKIKDLKQGPRSSLIRKEIGFILKRNNLLSYLKVLENVLLPMIHADSDQAKKMLLEVGLSDFNKYPDELSHLEQQKVALVRSMINRPSLILGDEVTGELDKEDTAKFMKILCSLKSEFTIILATDNPRLAKYADELLEIEQGILVH